MLVNRDWSGEQVSVQKNCLKFWLHAGQPTKNIPAVCICTTAMQSASSQPQSDSHIRDGCLSL